MPSSVVQSDSVLAVNVGAAQTRAVLFDVVEGEYRCDYAYHAQMEPLNAVASVAPGGDAVEIWAGTQSQTTASEAPAKFLGISRDKVKLHDLLMGGGFGRRGNRDVDFIMDAVMLSKEVKRPVKAMWTREDDVHNGRQRPMSAHFLKAGFDASGKLNAWQHRVACDGTFQSPNERLLDLELLDDRLDHESAVLVCRHVVAQRRPLKVDARHQLVRRVAAQAIFLNLAVHRLCNDRLGPLRCAL